MQASVQDVTARKDEDEPPGPAAAAPQPCAACGDIPEQIIEIAEQVVELPLAEDSGVPELVP
jgi:hypothetical protein